ARERRKFTVLVVDADCKRAVVVVAYGGEQIVGIVGPLIAATAAVRRIAGERAELVGACRDDCGGEGCDGDQDDGDRSIEPEECEFPAAHSNSFRFSQRSSASVQETRAWRRRRWHGRT